MLRSALLSACAVTVLLAAACAGGPGGEPEMEPGETMAPSPVATEEPSTEEPPTRRATQAPSPAPAYSTWELGARPLPLRPDGFGEVRPTPPSLRNRRYPTADPLGPAPQDGTFVSSIDAVSPAVRRGMGETYGPTCPVPLEDLRYLTLTFRGFDGRAHLGELVVAETVARDVVSVFRRLFRADYPIEEMRLPTTADLEAAPTGDGNNTAATVCRATTGSTTISAHALGLAIDVNPFLNPYLKDDLVLPERASAYLDRDRIRPGMITPDSVVVRSFERIGWAWGGDYESLKDYQHFSATGR